jgi:hypothetical protein
MGLLKKMFSIKLWGYFLKKFSQAVFPVHIVLLVFAFMNQKAFKNRPAFRFALILFVFGFCYRCFVFFAGVPFSRRYFYGMLVVVVLLATAGIPKLAEIIHKLISKRYPKIDLKKIIVFLTMVACLISLGKALNPDFSKEYLHEIPTTIKKLCPEGVRPVLLTTSQDRRISYYSGAEYIMFSEYKQPIRWMLKDGKVERFDDHRYGAILTTSQGKHYGQYLILDYPVGIEHLKDNIEKMGGERVFMVIEEDDEKFRERFKKANIEFPLKYIQTFWEMKRGKKKDPPMVLYQGFPVKEENKWRMKAEHLTDYDHLKK